MKHFVYILTISLLSSVFTLSAQQFLNVKYNMDTPFTGIYTAKRFAGNSIVTNEYDGNGMIVNKSTLEYRRSKDGLRDTIITNSGAMSMDEYVYSGDGKLLSVKKLSSSGTETNFRYDTDGRIESIVQNASDSVSTTTVYDYQNNNIVTTDEKGYVCDSTQIQYTDSGYIATKKEFNIGKIDGKDTSYVTELMVEYTFDNDQLMRQEVSSMNYEDKYLYSYTDSGYTIISDSTFREYVCQKDGFVAKIIDRRLTKNNGWQLYLITEFLYIGGLNPQSIAPIAASSKVYAAGGSITIEAEKAATVSVYTFGGQMLKQQTIAAGTTQIPMAKGLYIVTVNGEGYKVLVK